MKRFLSVFSGLIKSSIITIRRFHGILIRAFKKIPKAILIMTKVEKIALTVLAIIAVALFIAKGIEIYHQNTKVQPVVGGSLIFGSTQEPVNLNPLFVQNDSDRAITNLVFLPLVKISPNGKMEKVLIEKHSASKDYKEFTVSLKSGLKWQDLKPITIEDVIYTFSVIKSPEYNGIYKDIFKNISFEEVDDKTIKFILPAPYKNFMSALDIKILPSHLLSGKAISELASDSFSKKPIGNGPYLIRKSNLTGASKFVTLEYFKDCIVKTKIKKIEFKFEKTNENIYFDLSKGRVNSLINIINDKSKELKKNSDNQIITNRLLQYNVLHLNPENALLNNLSVRKAIKYAINKSEIAEKVFNKQAIIATSAIASGVYAHRSYDDIYDVATSKSILSNLGWSLNSTGIFEKDGEILQFNLTCPDTENFKETADLIKNQLKTVGIKANVQIIDPAKFQTEILPKRNYDILLIGETLGNDLDLYPYWHSSQTNENGLNLSSYKNEELDKLLDEVRIETDLTKKKDLYFKIQDIIHDDIPAVFLTQPVDEFLVPSNVKNIKSYAIAEGSDFFYYIDEWYIKLGRGPKGN